MDRADERRGGWVATGRHASVVAGGAAVLLAVAESIAHAENTPSDGRAGTALYFVILPMLGLATTLPLALLWSQPAAAALVTTATIVLSLVAFQTMTAAALATQLLTAYRLGRAGPRASAVCAAVPFPVLALAHPAGGEAGVLTLLLASLAPATVVAGIARRAYGEAGENRAARQVIAETLLENTARGERARIARELHDIVAHHISLVAVQAERARLATPGMPAAGAERLLAIGDTARAALTEMRRLLGVLRDDTAAANDTTAAVADRKPQPGLRELNELVDRSREVSKAGTRLILRGRPVTLDPGVELAAYRIVQEALTNARRHAPGAAVDVELAYTDDTLRLRIRDNGPGLTVDAPVSGHGLSGMRERAGAVGGDLRAGSAAGGGFLVETHLPGKSETAT